MENTEHTSAEHHHHAAHSHKPKWFHNSWLSKSTLLIAGLFFLMPFININCSGNKLASIRGIDMVIGTELKPNVPGQKEEEKIEPSMHEKHEEEPAKEAEKSTQTDDTTLASLNAGLDSLSASLNSLGDSIGASMEKAMTQENPFNMGMPMDMMGGKDKKIEPNALAIGSFAFILLAIALSFFKQRAMAVVSGVICVLSALALFFIQVQVADEFQKQMGPMSFIPITFEFTSFYWLSLLFVTIAAVFSFIRSSYKPA